jgi:hypothetical protein
MVSAMAIAQNDKNYVDDLVSKFTSSLEARQINDYLYLYKYCDGTTEMFKLEDGSMCISKGTYYEVYVFWKEGNQDMIKKIDNCGLYFSFPLNNSSVLDFVKINSEKLANNKVAKYAVKNPENVPAKSSKVHRCHSAFVFNIENNSFEQNYNLYDLTNESKYENINFERNKKLKIVALEKMIETHISGLESKFKRQF